MTERAIASPLPRSRPPLRDGGRSAREPSVACL